MKADLHVHSTASDGTLSPSELVSLALAVEVTHLALTDHDSIEGLAEATAAAAGTELAVIPAVELSSTTLDGTDAHILGLFVCPEDEALLAKLAELRDARRDRAEQMVSLLRRSGYDVSLDAVLALAVGGAVGRSHVARALVDAGHVSSVVEAFQSLLGRGRPFYVAKQVPTPAEVVSLIRSAGGLAFVAHPGVNGLDALIHDLAEDGLAGIEAYHPDHGPEQTDHYVRLAGDLGLLVSGGTDFHGLTAPNPPLGSTRLPEEAIQALLRAAGAA